MVVRVGSYLVDGEHILPLSVGTVESAILLVYLVIDAGFKAGGYRSHIAVARNADQQTIQYDNTAHGPEIVPATRPQ